MHMQNKKAFTLVELIVVIIILAILWTISFIAIQGYTKKARDSVRKTDIWIIIKSLEVYKVKTWIYPEPTAPTEVTFSWAEVWTQWVIWKSVIDVVDWLNKVLKDPLIDLPYTYSALNTKREFEVAAVFEWNISINNNLKLLEETYAWDQIWTAYVKWTYNRVLAKVSTWWTVYSLAVPTIISWDITEVNILALKLANKLVYHGKNNLPSNYSSSQFNVDWWWFEFNPSSIVAYTWTIASLDETDNQVTLLNNLKTIYTWTDVVDLNSDIKKIDDITIDTENPSDEVKELATFIIKNSINPNIELYVSSWTGTESSSYSETAFVSERKTNNSWLSEDNQIKLPLQSNGTYNFTVDWWDWNEDTITTYNQAEVTHTYDSAWTYEIVIDWTMQWFAFNAWSYDDDDLDDWDKLLDISQWWDITTIWLMRTVC